MNIPVKYIPPSETLELRFMPYWPGRRLWIRDTKEWFSTVGRWCPHISINGFECNDCALNVE